ncbi:MAG: hypothetical protein ABJO67_15885 [Pseudoruegeria sp.]
MGHQTKITTCCYCGAKAALVLKGKERHELACNTCGAPLHDLKWLKTPDPAHPAHKSKPSKTKPQYHKAKKSKKKSKKKRSLGGFILHEAFDLIEDIFD